MASRCLVRGSINVDEFFQGKGFDDIVSPGQTISSTNLVRRPGGKGANQAAAIARAGGLVDLVSAVGHDGTWVRDELTASGVNTESVAVVQVHLVSFSASDLVSNSRRKAPDARSSKCRRAENSIILFKGANDSTLPSHTIHPDTTHLVLQNEIPLKDTLDYLSIASARNIASVFNPSPMPSAEELLHFPWNDLTWLVVNNGEMREICVALGLAIPPALPSAAVDCARVLLHLLAKHTPKTKIVCTSAVMGCSQDWARKTGLRARRQATRIKSRYDGCGDCFTGYLVAGLMDLSVDKRMTTSRSSGERHRPRECVWKSRVQWRASLWPLTLMLV
ncbi:unnamed protein product [Mycena citricolor]|uniref:Carbohydrate kinase PfkB domain-containing protein n=1 Tax=Mycena citricolor TaxID=2018698 RepID=A0AAD2GTN4_9AGAR|nr:unnamed protein product [Mycena citricolor]